MVLGDTGYGLRDVWLGSMDFCTTGQFDPLRVNSCLPASVAPSNVPLVQFLGILRAGSVETGTELTPGVVECPKELPVFRPEAETSALGPEPVRDAVETDDAEENEEVEEE